MQNDLIDFLSKLKYCRDGNEVWGLLSKTTANMGYNVTSMTVLPTPGKINDDRICRSNYKYDWHTHFNENNYHGHDGFIRHFMKSKLPTFVDSNRNDSLFEWDTQTGRKMLNELKEVGLERSICVPMINATGSLDGSISIGSNQFADEDFRHSYNKDFPTLYGLLTQSYSQMNCNAREEHIRDILRLTTRQYDILMLIGAGLTNKQIAYKLGIKDVTVSFHLNDIKKALGCSVNRQILPKAYAMGLF